MNGYANITICGDIGGNGLNLDWHGGNGAIAAMLAETKRRLNYDGTDQFIEHHKKIEARAKRTEFYAVFYGVAREFYAYCGWHKNKSAVDVSMSLTAEGDNIKHYHINEKLECGATRVEFFTKEDHLNYNTMVEFYDKVHARLSAIEIEGPTTKLYDKYINQPIEPTNHNQSQFKIEWQGVFLKHIYDLLLSPRTTNRLLENNISTIGGLALLTERDLSCMPNLGKKGRAEIKDRLEALAKETGVNIHIGMREKELSAKSGS